MKDQNESCVCTFCGHSKIYSNTDSIRQTLTDTISRLIQNDNVNCFLVGNYGHFDRMAASVCLEMKNYYPRISACLVVPYYRPFLDDLEKNWDKRFDSVIVPELEHIPHPYRIIKANEYMVDASQYVVSYVFATTGGAYKTLKYAQKRQKNVINLYEKH